MPLLDQWEGEGARLYSPYLKGTLSFADLFAPSNEHRIFFTRLLALAHLELAGEWNTRLEMMLGAIVHTAVIAWLAALLMPLVTPQRRMLLACFVAILFAMPIGYENTIWGFQSHIYFAFLFGIAALVALAAARPFSSRWFGGVAATVLSYFSFATGVATIVAAGLVVSLQLATRARMRWRHEFAGVAVMGSIAAVMIISTALSANPTSTPRTFFQGFLQLVAPTIVAAIPAVWFCRHTVARRSPVSDRAWLAVGIVGWVAIQLALIAYGRGAVVAIRYMDTVLLIYPVALVAVFALVDQADATRFKRYARTGAVVWVFAVVAATTVLGYYVSVRGAVDWSKAARQQAFSVQAYLTTGNIDRLGARGGRDHTVDLTYPNPRRLADILQDPDVRGILPTEFRPAGADNAGARNRMWLRGAAASATGSVARFLLSIGPAILGIGVSLFFAVGAQGLCVARGTNSYGQSRSGRSTHRNRLLYQEMG